MKTTLPVDPFDPALCIGTVIEVGPTTVTAKLPDETPPEADWRNGYRFDGGRVGDFVIVELDDAAIFGRIIGVRLSDDFALPPEAGGHHHHQSIATIRLLSTIRLEDETIETGLSRYPSLGSRVYATDPGLIRGIAELSAEGNQEDSTLMMRLGSMPGAELIAVRTAPERLFGRHCAVIGATGGGKSWTLARLMEETAGFPGAKVILFDATGEFHTLGDLARHVQIGEGEAELDLAMRDLRAAGVEILTLGQYLRPSPEHVPVLKWWHPDEFAALREYGQSLGFAHVEELKLDTHGRRRRLDILPFRPVGRVIEVVKGRDSLAARQQLPE